jgi:hypothetical protein
MSDLPTGLLLDGVLALLLVATIFYCYILNRRLGNIRAASDQMKNLVGKFSTATEQAKAGITALRIAAEDDGQKLQDAIDMARVMRDELAFLSESGDALASRLAGTRKSEISKASTPLPKGPDVAVEPRPTTGPAIPAAPGAEESEIQAALEVARAATEGGEGPDSEAERQLLQALRQVR